MKIKFKFDKLGNIVVKNNMDDRDIYLQDSQDIEAFVECNFGTRSDWEDREGEWFDDPGYFDTEKKEISQ